MSIQDTAAVRVPGLYRAEILRYASSLLDPRNRDSGQVTETAVPLLEWAQRATGKGDLEYRMQAMQRAHVNSLQRPKRLTPAEFLTETGAYYGFMTQVAA